MNKNKELKIILNGNPATKKNSSQIKYRYNNRLRRSVPMIIPSENYNAYRELCLYQLNPIVNKADFKPIDYPVNLKCIYYKEDFTVCDITNLMSATHDILEDAGILAEDSWKVVESVDGTRIRFDSDNPRVEITITPINSSDTSLSIVNRIKKEEDERIKEERRLRNKRKEEDKKRKTKNIVKMRDVENLTFKAISEVVGLSPSTVSKYYKEYHNNKE